MQYVTSLRELKDANEKQSRALTEERVRNSELTRTVDYYKSQLGEPRPSKPPSNDRLLEEQNRKLTKEVESLRQELATVRSQSWVPSQSISEATEFKKLTTEVEFLQNEVKHQRDRATELEVKLRSVSSASQGCTLCEVFRSQLAAKENAIVEKDSKLALLTTKLQKFDLVAANTAAVVSESKQMAAQKNDLEVGHIYICMFGEYIRADGLFFFNPSCSLFHFNNLKNGLFVLNDVMVCVHVCVCVCVCSCYSTFMYRYRDVHYIILWKIF